ncbi:MAG: hypothetical protein LKM30_07980 [Bacilli bacterium]|jgi:hypothetical protein|nr:hypothetical protein [Bacilli bacterium]
MSKQTTFVKALILLAASFSLAGCSQQDYYQQTFGSKIPTTQVKDLDSYVLIPDVSLLNSIARYDAAVILVSRIGCHYCGADLVNLKSYVAKTHTLVYVVDSITYKEAYEDKSNETGDYARLYPQIQGTPTYLFYNGGKLVNSHNGVFGSDSYEANLSQYLVDYGYVSLNTFTHDPEQTGFYADSYAIDVDDTSDWWGYSTTALDKALSEGGKTTVLFTWRRCTDCKNYHQQVLDSYLLKNPSLSIYYFEVDGYYLKKRSGDEATATEGLAGWASFCQKYHLTDMPGYTTPAGQATGVVPTLVTFDGTGHTTSVFANDKDPLRNEDGTLSYTTSFYADVKTLKSSTKVSLGDTTSSTYQKALSELATKAQALEAKLCLSYLEANLG